MELKSLAPRSKLFKGEDRELFKDAMTKIGLDVARSAYARSQEEARAAADELGKYPLIIRPSFTPAERGGHCLQP